MNNKSGSEKMMMMWKLKEVGPAITTILVATPKLEHGRLGG
jgi:hypothetical protein